MNKRYEVLTKYIKFKYEKCTAIERSTAWMKSIFSTMILLSLPANKAASLTRLAKSALQDVQKVSISMPDIIRKQYL